MLLFFLDQEFLNQSSLRCLQRRLSFSAKKDPKMRKVWTAAAALASQ